MDFENVKELKELLAELQNGLTEEVKNDKEYEGQADELIGRLKRVQEQMKDVDNKDQLKKLFGEFGWDFINIYVAIQELIDFDDEIDFDFDFDEMEVESEENATV